LSDLRLAKSLYAMQSIAKSQIVTLKSTIVW